MDSEQLLAAIKSLGLLIPSLLHTHAHAHRSLWESLRRRSVLCTGLHFSHITLGVYTGFHFSHVTLGSLHWPPHHFEWSTPASISVTSLWVVYTGLHFSPITLGLNWLSLEDKEEAVPTVMTGGRLVTLDFWVSSMAFPNESKAVSRFPFPLLLGTSKLATPKVLVAKAFGSYVFPCWDSPQVWPFGFQHEVMPLGFCYSETSSFLLKLGPLHLQSLLWPSLS